MSGNDNYSNQIKIFYLHNVNLLSVIIIIYHRTTVVIIIKKKSSDEFSKTTKIHINLNNIIKTEYQQIIHSIMTNTV